MQSAVQIGFDRCTAHLPQFNIGREWPVLPRGLGLSAAVNRAAFKISLYLASIQPTQMLYLAYMLSAAVDRAAFKIATIAKS